MKFGAKNIIRKTAVFIIVTVLFSACSFSVCPVSASYYTAGADDLKSLGLFLGTDSGYELDRAPTRAEAAVMLVRLLGKEAEAKDTNYPHPFTDVPDWASPYVGYLYKNQLTNGIGNNQFGSAGLCSGQMFCAFMLRALGYAEAAGDFTYDKSVEFGTKIGIIAPYMANAISGSADYQFWRDDCVSIMTNTLNAKIKGADTVLIKKLAGDKAVDEKKAGDFISKNSLRTELNQLLGQVAVFDEKSVSIEIDEMENTPFAPGDIPDGMTVNYTNSASDIINLTVSDGNFAIKLTKNSYGIISVDSEEYLKDGYLYMNSIGGKTKQEATEDDSAASLFKELKDLYGYYFTEVEAGEVNKIEKTVSDTGVIYKIYYTGNVDYRDIINSAETGGGQDNAPSSYSYGETITYTFTPGGKLISVGDEYKEISGGNLSYETSTDITVKAVGDDVTIEFPDFSGYTDTSSDLPLPSDIVGV